MLKDLYNVMLLPRDTKTINGLSIYFILEWKPMLIIIIVTSISGFLLFFTLKYS